MVDRVKGVAKQLRALVRKDRVEDELDEEVRFHIHMETQRLIREGMSAEAARRRARLEFGAMERFKEEVRDARWTRGIEDLMHHLRYASKSLRRSPGFTAAAVLTVALGIGVNAAMFGITDRLLLSAPAHIAEPDEVVRVLYRSTPPWDGQLRVESIMPYADYTALRDHVDAFQAVAAYSVPSFSVLGRGGGSAEVRIVGASPDYFPLLGVRPDRGRFFTREEGVEPRGERVLVLSHPLWRTAFGSDPEVIGREVELDNATFRVIGVAPRGFHGIDLEPVDGWIPISASTAAEQEGWNTGRWMNWVRIVARTAPGLSSEVAAAQATSVYLSAEEYQERYANDPTAAIVLGSVIPARAPVVGLGTAQRSGRVALWLLGVSTLVLLIACLNLANLVLARGMGRRQENGIRLALGMGRLRLAGHVLTETLLIAVLGAALGLLLVPWGARLTHVLLLPEYDWQGTPLSGRVLLFAGVVALLSAVVAGLVPALYAARSNVSTLLSLGGRGTTHRKTTVRSALVVLQVALSVLLLVGAGLFVRSFQNARERPLGYDADRLVLIEWHRTRMNWDASRVRAVYDASLERAGVLPEVEAAALSMTAPMWSAMGAQIRVPGRDSVPTPPGMAGFVYDAVSPGYFRTLGTRLLRGRGFTGVDRAGSAPVVIVTETLADWLWPGEDAVGRCFVHLQGEDPPCREVVGVVESIRYRNVEDDPTAMFFIPLAQGPAFPSRVLTVRAQNDPERAIASVQRALQGVEPGMPPLKGTVLRHRIDPQLQPWRLGASLFFAFGVLALLLASVGLYGVVAYDVTQRRRELAVRLALGARSRRILSRVLGDAGRLVVFGLALGLGIAFWTVGLLEALLFNVAPHDWVVFAGVALVLLLVGTAAALLPGLRAARVQPAEVLREE